MTEPGRPRSSFTEELRRVQELIDTLEAEVPATYRLELFRALLPRTISADAVALADPGTDAPARASPAGRDPDAGMARGTAVATEPGVRPAPTTAGRYRPEDRSRRIDLAGYAPLLVLPGRPLLKALAALDVANDQLAIEWLTPAEIEYLLTQRARARSVYRTNVSTALRGSPDLVDRRQRGRGYEYRINERGRAALRRELRLRGAERD